MTNTQGESPNDTLVKIDTFGWNRYYQFNTDKSWSDDFMSINFSRTILCLYDIVRWTCGGVRMIRVKLPAYHDSSRRLRGGGGGRKGQRHGLVKSAHERNDIFRKQTSGNSERLKFNFATNHCFRRFVIIAIVLYTTLYFIVSRKTHKH